jgi:hypothetical protein
MQPTLDQLIEDITAINQGKNVKLPYNLHPFITELGQAQLLHRFEIFLREYRVSKNEG